MGTTGQIYSPAVVLLQQINCVSRIKISTVFHFCNNPD
jgi:hypothetical protein